MNSGISFVACAITVLSACCLAPFVSFPRYGIQTLVILSLWPLWHLRNQLFFRPLFIASLFLLTLGYWQIDREKPLNAVSHWAPSERFNLCGRVEEPPRVFRQGTRVRLVFPMKAKTVIFFEGDQKKEIKVHGRVWVKLYHAARAPAYGDQVLVAGKLSEPRMARNPHVFDERRWLESIGVEAVLQGYGTKSLAILGKAPDRSRALEFLFDQREKITQQISNLWPERTARYLKALITGDRQQINRDEREIFIRTGTAHLLAISGLHFTLITGIFILFLTLMGVRRQAAAFLGLLFISCYVFLAGYGISVRRAGAMAAFGLGAVLLERPSRSLTVLCFVFCGFIFFDTRILGSVSFQLSFLAVLFLVVFLNEKSFLLSVPINVKTTCVAASATFAIAAVVFNGFSLISIPANLLIVPLFNTALFFAFGALLFSDFLLIGPLLASAAGTFLEGGLSLLSWFASIPGVYVSVARPPFWIMALHIFLGGVVVLGKAQVLRLSKRTQSSVLGAWVISAVLFFVPIKKIDHTPELIFFETQKNLALQVSFERGQEWFFSLESGRFIKDSEWTFEPYWKAQGIDALQGVVNFRETSAENQSRSPEIFKIPVLSYWQTTSGATELDSQRLGAGGRISFGNKQKNGFTVLGHIRNRAVLQIHLKEKNILVLPEVGLDTVLLIKRLKHLVENSQVIILNRVREESRGSFLEILELVRPQMVLAARDLPEEVLENLWEKTKVRLVSQESGGGALSLKFENQGIFLQGIKPEFRIDTPG